MTPAARESVEVKAVRLLASGALTVRQVDGDRITATCRGDTGLYHCGHHPRTRGGWYCTCAARAQCAHLLALQAVTRPQAADLEHGGTRAAAA